MGCVKSYALGMFRMTSARDVNRHRYTSVGMLTFIQTLHSGTCTVAWSMAHFPAHSAAVRKRIVHSCALVRATACLRLRRTDGTTSNIGSLW